MWDVNGEWNGDGLSDGMEMGMERIGIMTCRRMVTRSAPGVI